MSRSFQASAPVQQGEGFVQDSLFLLGLLYAEASTGAGGSAHVFAVARAPLEPFCPHCILGVPARGQAVGGVLGGVGASRSSRAEHEFALPGLAGGAVEPLVNGVANPVLALVHSDDQRDTAPERGEVWTLHLATLKPLLLRRAPPVRLLLLLLLVRGQGILALEDLDHHFGQELTSGTDAASGA